MPSSSNPPRWRGRPRGLCGPAKPLLPPPPACLRAESYRDIVTPYLFLVFRGCFWARVLSRLLNQPFHRRPPFVPHLFLRLEKKRRCGIKSQNLKLMQRSKNRKPSHVKSRKFAWKVGRASDVIFLLGLSSICLLLVVSLR